MENFKKCSQGQKSTHIMNRKKCATLNLLKVLCLTDTVVVRIIGTHGTYDVKKKKSALFILLIYIYTVFKSPKS